VEDSEDDAALTLHQIVKGGYEPRHLRVDSEAAMRAALADQEWDIVLSDYNMPGFSGISALELLRETGMDIPFIIISGAIGEETAVEVMKVGAHDYIMKDNLVRLVPAIERELREAEVRRARRRDEEDLRLAAEVFESSMEGIIITDASTRILRVNRAFTEITGYTAEEIVGKTPQAIASGLHGSDFYRHMWDSIKEQGFWHGEILDRRKNGEIYPEWLTISAVRDEQGEVTHYIGGFTDLSQQREAEEHIQHLIHYDALTDLPNRVLFREYFQDAMRAARRDGKRMAFLHLDLDRFITVNDSLGHQVGDRILQQVGRRLMGTARRQDLVARYGGDEFIIAMTGLDDMGEVSAFTRVLLDNFSEPFRDEGREIFLTPNIGVAIYPDHTENYDELTKFADIALHQAKRPGGAHVELYREAMNHEAMARLDLESSLRRALERKEFQLHYQPQVDIATGYVIGAESLLRWRRPDGRMALPGEYIPLLEETGLIVPVGRWVLRQACLDRKRWSKTGHGRIPIAVNLSPCQFHDRQLVEMVRSVLEETATPPSCLELEITESSVMDDPDFALSTLEVLHQMGIRIAIDDFGTGYSSLSYLKRFPIDVLKIDRSFVMGLTEDENDAVIVDMIIALAHRLKLCVIAEGVETAEQLHFLEKLGCDRVQGYYHSRPVRCGDFHQYLCPGAQ